MQEIPKQFNFASDEENIYKRWEESGFFNPDNLDGEPYSIMMPPPNVTGVLHLGHAWENSLMDIMARYQRMQGKKVLLLPGTDHAAVATQAKVEKNLAEKGIKDPRKELGREKLLEEIRAFAEKSKTTILSQIKKMGTSCDWSRLAYTFDEKRSRAVNEVFVKMYADGLIYRGYRVINWSVKGQCTCSDDELVHIERSAKLYTFKYSHEFPISIATTRPETKLGDTAVAVNPNDKRYRKYIGKTLTVDVGAEKPLAIKIIADESIDMNFGTGAVGVTPAHSLADFEMFEKQKSKGDPIELIQVIDQSGKMTEKAGKEYAGLSAEEAREKFSSWLKEKNLLEKVEDITQNAGTSDRFGDVVEALPMTQWFVDVNKKIPGKGKSLKELMRDAVAIGHNGDPQQKIKIIPERFEKTYFNWIDNLRDWCISRQIWWGHRIPVWYRGEEIFCGANSPEKEGWTQDPDTLDTWFSSGLWTFSTLGWPEKTEDLKIFHPTSWMQMGYEILFFWMARMIMMSAYALDQIPFRDVYIHGILRDEKGRKFSKSDGNTLDPLHIIEKYGADALRLSLITGTTPGLDAKFYEEKVETSRNFVNKLWNISRYILSLDQKTKEKPVAESLLPSDVWILQKFDSLIEGISNNFEKFQFSQASERLMEFTRNDLADWYLEVSKFEKNKDVKAWVLKNILRDLIKMWHPFVPFVTENIWSSIDGDRRLLSVENWPTKDAYQIEMEVWKKDNRFRYFELIKNIISSVRTIRIENKIDLKLKLDVIVRIPSKENQKFKTVIEKEAEMIKKLRTGIGTLTVEISDKPMKNAYCKSIGAMNIYVLTKGLIDIKSEKKKYQKEIENLEKFINGLEARLKNKKFIQKAPEQVIAQQKESLEKSKAKLKEIKKHQKELKTAV